MSDALRRDCLRYEIKPYQDISGGLWFEVFNRAGKLVKAPFKDKIDAEIWVHNRIAEDDYYDL